MENIQSAYEQKKLVLSYIGDWSLAILCLLPNMLQLPSISMELCLNLIQALVVPHAATIPIILLSR